MNNPSKDNPIPAEPKMPTVPAKQAGTTFPLYPAARNVMDQWMDNWEGGEW